MISLNHYGNIRVMYMSRSDPISQMRKASSDGWLTCPKAVESALKLKLDSKSSTLPSSTYSPVPCLSCLLRSMLFSGYSNRQGTGREQYEHIKSKINLGKTRR